MQESDQVHEDGDEAYDAQHGDEREDIIQHGESHGMILK